MATTKGPASRLPDKLAERLTERPGLPHQEHWSEGTEIEPPRRQMPVGHVLVVGLVALIFGAFLNAPGLLDTAKSQPLNSFRRDVSLFFARPLNSVSGFLQISRPHQWLEDALGRKNAGSSSRALPTPTTTSPGGSPATTEPRRVPTAAKPLRMWCGGDSLAQRPCDALIEQATATGVITSVAPTESEVSTGLARPEVFNWPARIAEVTAADDPDVVVIVWGANDDQLLSDPSGNFSPNPEGSPEWIAEYSNRVGGLMDQIIGEGRTVVWVGIPPTGDEGRNGTYRTINDIARKEARKREGRAEYVNTYDIFATPEGTYTDFVSCPPGSDSEPVLAREADRVHLNPTGGNCLATAILDNIDSLWHFNQPAEERPAGDQGGKRGQ